MYYALIASLPHLTLEKEPQISADSFREACRSTVSADEYDVLNALLQGSVKHPSTHSFAQRWFGAETQLRNAVATQRAQARGVDVKTFIRPHTGFLGWIETHVQEAFVADNPAEQERILDGARWQLAEDFIGEDTFGFAKLAAYAVQLRLATRWNRMDDNTGRENLEKTITLNTESEAAAVN